MATRVRREWTVEDFEEWSKAQSNFEAIAKASDEQGGPSLSLVPAVEQQNAWPTDLLAPTPDAVSPESNGASADDQALVQATPIDGLPLQSSRNRLAGWSAERQRLFLGVLAETGSVHLASGAARLTARSAYQLRTRSPAFAKAWNAAEQLAVGRLAAIAFDRAINGRVEQIFREGELIGEKRVPNDKILMWLLARLDPRRFAMPWERRGDGDPQAEALDSFPALLEGIRDEVS